MPTQPAAAATVHVATLQPTFASILFDDPDRDVVIADRSPDYFTDLNLDQLVTSILTGRGEYDLAPVFYAPLTAPHTVAHRQDIFRDLEQPPVADCITQFCRGYAGDPSGARPIRPATVFRCSDKPGISPPH